MIELETKFAFQEDLLSALNDEVAHQQRQIAELVREMALLKSQMGDLLARDTKSIATESEHEVPPHY